MTKLYLASGIYGRVAFDAGFEEGKHPRDQDGKFGSGGGGGKENSEPTKKTSEERYQALGKQLRGAGYKSVSSGRDTSQWRVFTTFLHPRGRVGDEDEGGRGARLTVGQKKGDGSIGFSVAWEDGGGFSKKKDFSSLHDASEYANSLHR